MIFLRHVIFRLVSLHLLILWLLVSEANLEASIVKRASKEKRSNKFKASVEFFLKRILIIYQAFIHSSSLISFYHGFFHYRFIGCMRWPCWSDSFFITRSLHGRISQSFIYQRSLCDLIPLTGRFIAP